MKINLPFVSLYFASTLFAMAVSADSCTPGKHPASTPTERFSVNSDGSVLDKQTGLTWMRCALGQSWNAGTCTGTATGYAWHDADWAKDAVNLDGYAGHTDWRVPLVPELASIVELGCADHRINDTVFPKTPSGPFWSRTEKPRTEDLAYALDFGAGGAAAKLKTSSASLRLVRGGPWWSPPGASKP